MFDIEVSLNMAYQDLKHYVKVQTTRGDAYGPKTDFQNLKNHLKLLKFLCNLY